MSGKSPNRRQFLAGSAKVSAAALAASHLPAWAIDEYGGYSGNKAHKYINAPATYFNFGLSNEEEARAVELHKNIISFDMLMECTFYPEILKNAKAGGLTACNFS